MLKHILIMLAVYINQFIDALKFIVVSDIN